MKKTKNRITAIVAVLVLALAAFPVSAFAFTGDVNNGGTAGTSVTYTANASYTIEIPASIEIGKEGSANFEITCTNNSMPVGKTVVVAVNAGATFSEDGLFYLQSNSNSDKIRCDIISNSQTVSAANKELCQFADGSKKVTAGDEFVSLQLSGFAPSPGTYAGYITFDISVIDK